MDCNPTGSATRGENADQATLGALCRYFLRLGTLGFGGPVALVGYMQRDLVEERRWVSEREFRDGLAVAQLAPGPLAAQLAMWLAFIRTGVLGATLASFAFIGPSFVMVLAMALIYVGAGGASWIGALFYGVAPAAVAIIALSAYRLVPVTVGRDPLLAAILAVVGLVTLLTGSEIALAFLGAGLLMMVIRAGLPVLLWAIGRASRRAAPAVMGLASAGPVGQQDASLLLELGLLFAKAGAFVFGSGLAIVPFLRETLLVENQWLTEQQFVDSVAVGLITPGPVVITVAFAGYLIADLPGAVVAAVGVFTPVYLFVILPGPWIARHKDAPAVQAFVAGVSAAACGAILAVSVIIGRDAIRDATQATIALCALLALIAIRRFKPQHVTPVAEPLVIAVAAILGLAVA